jgi:putative ABC transport system permease protein
MLLNYLIIALRNLSRFKTYSFINVTGLSIELSTFLIFQKTNEIRISKVMGPSFMTIIRNLSGEYIRRMVIANLIALPTGYFLSKMFLNAFAYNISLSVWVFVFVSLFILLLAITTISFQAIKTSFKNPVYTLRYK